MARLASRGNTQRNGSGPPQGKKQKRNDGKSASDEWEDVCSICDDGGAVLCCEGKCLRSFHPTKHAGKESKCTTLGLTDEHWRIFKDSSLKYICNNCKYNQHQCFSCGLLGSSDLYSGAEVFQCEDKKCGHFYHPKCVARLLYPDSDMQALHFEQQVATGLKFHCPIHKCHVCKTGENKDDEEMQFALCRRCPTAYHRKCLPSDIAFEDSESEDIMQRAWDGVLPHQILIYCMKHEILPELGTPKRDHIVFPDVKNLSMHDPSKVEGRKGAPTEQDMPDQDPHQAAKSDYDPCFSSNGFDTFAPKSLFPLPYPGTCGWLDD